MRVDRPGKGTGAIVPHKRSELLRCNSHAPHRHPNWVRVLTDDKKAAVLAASSAFSPGCQTRLPMWGSGRMVAQSGGACKGGSLPC